MVEKSLLKNYIKNQKTIKTVKDLKNCWDTYKKVLKFSRSKQLALNLAEVEKGKLNLGLIGVSGK